MAARRRRAHPEAEQDLEDGILFHLRRSRVAAERFLDEVAAALDLIHEAPERYPL